MSLNTEEIFISCFEFKDVGMEVYLSEKIPFLPTNELNLVGNYYSLIVGSVEESKQSSGLFFGPLPVAYHHDKLVFVYSNTIRDPKIKDSRVVQRNFQTLCLVMIFFNAATDQLFSQSRVTIFNVITEWYRNKKEITDIDLKSLINLKISVINQIMQEQQNIDSLGASASLKTVLAKNLVFLNTVGQSLHRPLRLGIFGLSNATLIAIRNAIKENFELLQAMDSSLDIHLEVFRFANLILEGSYFKENEVIDLRKSSSMTHSWKNYPKDYDGILLELKITLENADKIKKSIQAVLKATIVRCPISILIRYSDEKNADIAMTSIPEVIRSEALNRTISLIESKGEEKTIEIAIIDLIEKVIPSLKEE